MTKDEVLRRAALIASAASKAAGDTDPHAQWACVEAIVSLVDDASRAPLSDEE